MAVKTYILSFSYKPLVVLGGVVACFYLVYLIIFYGNTLLSAFVIDAMFAVLDDVIENITGWENRVNIGDNGPILGIVQAEFAIVLLADVGCCYEFYSDLNVLCIDTYCCTCHDEQEDCNLFHTFICFMMYHFYLISLKL